MAYNYVVTNILWALNGEWGNETAEELPNLVKYFFPGYKIVDCPICGKKTRDMYATCTRCGWQYDDEINYDNADDNSISDCNETSVVEYKNVYRFLREVFEKSKGEKTEYFYIITCHLSNNSYKKGSSYYNPCYRTYGAFESIEACRKSLSDNGGNMHNRLYDFAVIDKVHIDTHFEEIKWFIWDDEKQEFYETENPDLINVWYGYVPG